MIELDDSQKNRPELIQQIMKAGGRVMAVTEESHSLEEVYFSLVQENGSNE